MGTQEQHSPSARHGRLQALSEALGQPQRTQNEGRVPPTAEEAASTAYGQVALRDELATLRATQEGGRNDQLNRSAFSLGQLVGGAVLDRTEVEASLLSAARSIGLDEKEITATIRSGLADGMNRPRCVPDHGALPSDEPAGPVVEEPAHDQPAETATDKPELTERDTFLLTQGAHDEGNASV